MRVLLVEDDDRIADFLQRALKTEGYTSVRASNGKEGLELARNADFELMILDLMLPQMSGLDVCQQLRMHGIEIPIIMLTAMDGIEDKIQGLRMGADDYMTKPFNIDELLARMESVSRRAGKISSETTLLRIGNIALERNSKVVTAGAQTVELTAKEIAILELLMTYPEKLFSRERILNNIWGMDTDPMTNVVDVYIGRLRKKLGKDKSPFIETVRGMGYRIDPNIR